MQALRQVDSWEVGNAAVAVLGPQGELGSRGDRGRRYRLASVTKLMTTLACLIAAEEGVIDLDEPAGPPGSTIRHLLAHTSGLPFEPGRPIAKPGARRIYSNAGFDTLGEALAERAEMPFGDYLREAVFVPLGLDATELRGSPAAGGLAPLADLIRFAHELMAPTLGARGRPPGNRPLRPARLGPRLRAQGREGAALERGPHVAAHIRPLRRQWHLPLGRPGCGDRLRVSHRPRVRPVGARGLAAAVRLGPRRSPRFLGAFRPSRRHA